MIEKLWKLCAECSRIDRHLRNYPDSELVWTLRVLERACRSIVLHMLIVASLAAQHGRALIDALPQQWRWLWWAKRAMDAPSRR